MSRGFELVEAVWYFHANWVMKYATSSSNFGTRSRHLKSKLQGVARWRILWKGDSFWLRTILPTASLHPNNIVCIDCFMHVHPRTWLGSLKNADLRKKLVEIQLWEFCVHVRMKIAGLCQSSIFFGVCGAAYPHNFTDTFKNCLPGISFRDFPNAAIWLHFQRSWSTPATTLLQSTLKQTRKRKKRMTVMTGVVAWENICPIGAVVCGFSSWSLLLCWCQKSWLG